MDKYQEHRFMTNNNEEENHLVTIGDNDEIKSAPEDIKSYRSVKKATNKRENMNPFRVFSYF